MNTKTLMITVGAFALMTAGSAMAGAGAVTRSVEDANADLMRTYQSHGGAPAGQVMSRSSAECYADLVRDWDGKLTQQQGAIVGVASTKTPVASRNTEDAYKDLMRIWQ